MQRSVTAKSERHQSYSYAKSVYFVVDNDVDDDEVVVVEDYGGGGEGREKVKERKEDDWEKITVWGSGYGSKEGLRGV